MHHSAAVFPCAIGRMAQGVGEESKGQEMKGVSAATLYSTAPHIRFLPPSLPFPCSSCALCPDIPTHTQLVHFWPLTPLRDMGFPQDPKSFPLTSPPSVLKRHLPRKISMALLFKITLPHTVPLPPARCFPWLSVLPTTGVCTSVPSIVFCSLKGRALVCFMPTLSPSA